MSTQEKAFGASLYFMNDQNIHDGMLAQRIKVEDLANILRDKSIVVAKSASKNELLDLMKTVRFDYFDYVQLSSLLENPDRKESKSSTDIDISVNVAVLTKAFSNLKKTLSPKGIEIDIEVTSNKKVTLKTSYLDVDHTKPPMRQKTRKSAEVEIRIANDSTTFNFPASTVGSEIKDEMIKEISSLVGKPLNPIEIDLEHYEPHKRTEFFTKLIAEIEGYEVYDVVGVHVESVFNTNNEVIDESFTGSVRHAILKGKEILSSSIYGSLDCDKYYIYKITWKLREVLPHHGSDISDCFTVDVEFLDNKKAKGFKYSIKSVQRFTRNRLNVTPSPIITKEEQASLSKLIYKTALAVYENIKNGE